MNSNFFKHCIYDIRKNKISFIILLLLFLASTILFTEIFHSYFVEVYMEQSDSYGFSAVPTSYEEKLNNNVYESLDNLLKKGGSTSFVSRFLNEKYNTNIQVFISNNIEEYSNKYIWIVPIDFMTENINQNFELINFNENIQVELKKLGILEFSDSSKYIFLISKSKEFQHLSDYNLYGTELIYLLENIKLDKADLENSLDNDYKNIFENTYIKLVDQNSKGKEEIRFIKLYMFPMLLCLIISNILAFFIIDRRIVENCKELRYIKSDGNAKLYQVKRNSAFIFILFVVNIIFLSIINKFRFNFAFFIIFTFSLIMFVIYELINYFILKYNKIEI